MKKHKELPQPQKRNFVVKHAKRSGAGVHKDKAGPKAPRNRQKQEWKKQIQEISLIQEINNSLKPRDLVQEAIKFVNRVYESDYEDENTALEDEQVEMLADYMKEMITSSIKRGKEMTPEEVAYLALEDVAGFETALPAILKQSVARLVHAYHKKYS